MENKSIKGNVQKTKNENGRLKLVMMFQLKDMEEQKVTTSNSRAIKRLCNKDMNLFDY